MQRFSVVGLRRLLVVAVAVALAFSAGSAFVAYGSEHDSVYYACAGPNGHLSQIMVNAQPKCNGNQHLVSWEAGATPAWEDIVGIPVALQDGQIDWTEIQNRPAGLDDGDDVGDATALEERIATLEGQLASLVNPPTISIDDVSQLEGNSGTTAFTYTISLSTASSLEVTVQYATSDAGASAANDYQAASGSLTFASGETAKTVTVEVNGDTFPEMDETFAVNLSNPVNAVLGDGQAIGTIQNDDQPSIRIDDMVCPEGSLCVIWVRLSGPIPDVVTVDFTTRDGTAVSGSDYGATNGRLVFEPGTTEKPIGIPIAPGTLGSEPNEVFFVDLSAPVHATIAKSTSQVMIPGP